MTPVYSPETFNHFEHNYSKTDALLLSQEHSDESCDIPCNITINYLSTTEHSDELCDVPFNIPLNDVSTVDVPLNNPLNDVLTIDVPFNNPLNDVSTTGLDVTSNSMLQDTGSLDGHGSGVFRVVSFKDILQLSQDALQLSQDHYSNVPNTLKVPLNTATNVPLNTLNVPLKVPLNIATNVPLNIALKDSRNLSGDFSGEFRVVHPKDAKYCIKYAIKYRIK